MPTSNRVTVGMPVYNDPSGLLRSVPTVFNQTWGGDVRLLIIDDGSTDGTPETISELQRMYPDTDVIRNAHNRGRPIARNQILDNADGEYLAWLDSGDLWHPRKLEMQFSVLSDLREDAGIPILCTSPFRWVFADAGQDRVKVPDVNGDQLHNALTSTLPPYLWTLLGRTSAFRSAGRFDERLPRRQDYEFFVRFIERGGRVVTTPHDQPLATYMKTDVGRSPEEVEEANEVIRELHAPLYARYGSGFARSMRRRQAVLEARFYENNGKRLTALVHRTRGWFSSPSLPSLGGLRKHASRWRQRLVKSGSRTVVRLLKPVLPGLRRLGVTNALRRVVKPEAVIPRYYQELEKGSPPDSDIAEALERDIEAEGGSASVSSWLQLEQAYRRSSQLESAQSALERARRQHPENDKLLIRLIELQPLRWNWDQCVRLWKALSPSQVGAAGPTTYNRVAWAYRELDDPRESLRVLDRGLERWPGDQWLLAQLRKVRALNTDWTHALQIDTSTAPPSDTLQDGLVTDLGFLRGDSGPVKGWLESVPEGDLPVNLMVNGTRVATTKAGAAAGGRLSFSFNCRDLLEYLGDGDVVWCESSGGPVPIAGGGDRCVFTTGYESRFNELRRRLDGGFVFENLGRLVEGNTSRRMNATLDLYDQVRALLADSFGYEVYPIYGNLLGAIRENDFIAHDVGGFDVVYVSRHTTPTLVREEFASICRHLVDNGYFLKLKPWSAYVRPRRSNDAFVDLNFAWFSNGEDLQLSYGWRNTPVNDPKRLRFPREGLIGNRWVPVPGNAESVLDQIYGPGWITPNQGYAPEEEMKRDHEYLLTAGDMAGVREHNPDLVLIAPDEPEPTSSTPMPGESADPLV